MANPNLKRIVKTSTTLSLKGTLDSDIGSINTEEDNTYDDFYAIITTGPIKVKGYCMKDYIEIK